MKVVVIGGTGLIGRKLAARLDSSGHEVVAASPSTGLIASPARGSTFVVIGLLAQALARSR